LSAKWSPRSASPDSGGARSFSRPQLLFSRDDETGHARLGHGHASVLVVEDDFLIAMEVESALAGAGLEIAGTAASVDEALELAKLRTPTLAIMDVRLAGRRDGVEGALELLREHGVRSIFATAHSDQDISRRAAPAQPLGWLQKPYTMTSLIEAIDRALDELKRSG
jgi:two-component system, response regulator PdtaR